MEIFNTVCALLACFVIGVAVRPALERRGWVPKS